MTKLLPLPPDEDHRAEVEQAIQEIRKLIVEAQGYIERQEDGPVTMRAALQEIAASVDRVETELCFLAGTIEWWQAFAEKIHEQRDEALQQRDTLLMVLRRSAH